MYQFCVYRVNVPVRQSRGNKTWFPHLKILLEKSDIYIKITIKELGHDYDFNSKDFPSRLCSWPSEWTDRGPGDFEGLHGGSEA